MSVVIVDNYDSFTYNLFQLTAGVTGGHVQVIRNDDYSTWSSIAPGSIEALIISPGPGRPEFESDFGISRLALEYDVPVLGVCLGHQGMCYFEGGIVTTAPEPCHGRTGAIQHDGTGLFEGIPSPFHATRYHSLVVSEVPDTLKTTAYTVDRSGKKLIMAVEHRFRPQWGVQFHPESIVSEYGRQLIVNFLKLAHVRPRRRDITKAAAAGARTPCQGAQSEPAMPAKRFRVMSSHLRTEPDAEKVYTSLFGDQDSAIWLDSSRVIEGLSRFSILGGCGPHGERVTADANGGVCVRSSDGTLARLPQSIFDYLGRQTAERAVTGVVNDCDFALGYVGYLGYEMKAECGGEAVHQSDLPDADFVFCDRAVVIDHKLGETWLLALADQAILDQSEAMSWLEHAEQIVACLAYRPRIRRARSRCSHCYSRISNQVHGQHPAVHEGDPRRGDLRGLPDDHRDGKRHNRCAGNVRRPPPAQSRSLWCTLATPGSRYFMCVSGAVPQNLRRSRGRG
jgi:para-aminobenzoate synthetase